MSSLGRRSTTVNNDLISLLQVYIPIEFVACKPFPPVLPGGVVVTDPHGKGVFAISVAAEMACMQIQNLRVYERRGLLEPRRTAGGTRLYSSHDVERLRRIGSLLAEGLNLAGIAKVLDLEERLLDATKSRPTQD
jgi:MerR family transcriptional regulator/heat shock protein HspR